MPAGSEACNFSVDVNVPNSSIRNGIQQCFEKGNAVFLFQYICDNIPHWSFEDVRMACWVITDLAKDPKNTAMAIETLTLLNDRRYSTGFKKRNHIIHIIRDALRRLLSSLPGFDIAESSESAYRLIDYESRDILRPPRPGETTLVINAKGFPPEGDDSDAALLFDGYIKGWRHFICFNCAGQRFIGCGLGPQTEGVTIDVYDSSGDYLGSGIDGLTITVHNNAQDQLGQIVKSGKMVIYGDTGQTFMYGAKGGSVYVMGNAAGRPLINSVGKPKVVINGTCLDFLAESFMAGDALNGGGFVILNGITFDDDGRMIAQREPYPGSNLFSLASGGAIYIRDPEKHVVQQQLNGGEFTPLTDKDWDLILPYLEENERLFGVKVDELLTIDGQRRMPAEVYRKVAPIALAALASTVDVSNE
jgi:glutamate synthase domain-containing protein 3